MSSLCQVMRINSVVEKLIVRDVNILCKSCRTSLMLLNLINACIFKLGAFGSQPDMVFSNTAKKSQTTDNISYLLHDSTLVSYFFSLTRRKKSGHVKNIDQEICHKLISDDSKELYDLLLVLLIMLHSLISY